jgi:glycoprotein 6-alpha-L-fucosyltransferase
VNQELFNIWGTFLKPLSSKCENDHILHSELEVVPNKNTVFERRLVNQLPKIFGPDLMKLIDSPVSWFHSQFIGFIMRPEPNFTNVLLDFKKSINFSHPIVGVQVRRTHRIPGAIYHRPDFMIHVKDYYEILELTQKINRRLVYISSDDPKVLNQFISEYPDYRFIGNIDGSKLVSNPETRYTKNSFKCILTDIYLLSETNYLVFLFSSGVSLKKIKNFRNISLQLILFLKICRLSYQLMRYSKGDESFSYRSLDVPYHYHHSLSPPRIATYNHKTNSHQQYKLKIGDRLYERFRPDYKTEWLDQAGEGRVWDSFFYASNTSDNQIFYKLYPNYKKKEDIELI